MAHFNFVISQNAKWGHAGFYIDCHRMTVPENILLQKKHCWALWTIFTHPFNGPLSATTRVSRYQKGKTSLDFTEARDSDWQWHQLGHMQVCTSLQTDNHTSTPPLSFLQAGCPSCHPTNSVKALWTIFNWYKINKHVCLWPARLSLITLAQLDVYSLQNVNKTNRRKELVTCWDISHFHKICVPCERFGITCHKITNVLCKF